MLRKPPNETLFLPHNKCPFFTALLCTAQVIETLKLSPGHALPWLMPCWYQWHARGRRFIATRTGASNRCHNIVQLWRNCSQLWSLKEGCNRRVRWMISHPWQIPWQTHGCGWQAWHWIWDYKIGFRLSGSFENWSWDARRAWKTLQTTFCRSISQCKMQTAKCKRQNAKDKMQRTK